MACSKSGKFRVLIITRDADLYVNLKQFIDSRPPLTFFARLKNYFSPPKIISKPFFEVNSAMDGASAEDSVSQSLQRNNPYSVVFIALKSSGDWHGINILRRLWRLDKALQAAILVDPSDKTWKNKISRLPMSANFVILKEPYDAISVRQLTYTLACKWELNIEAQLHAEAFEAHVKEKTSELHQKAHYDVLTRLPNRAKIIEDLEALIFSAQNTKQKIGVFFFDLDRLKYINDAFTHTVGDEVLMAVAERLRKSGADLNGLVGRFGGDEFVVVIPDCKDATKLVKEFSDIVKERHAIAGRKISVSACIGIALYPKDGKTAIELLRNSDTAMYTAKNIGTNKFKFYDSKFNIDVLKRFDFENELSHAIEMDQLVLHYQPEFNLITGELEGAEALMRWQHPQRGLVMPEDFIAIAEETGLIVPMGEWVIRAVCKQNKIWQESHMPHLRVAVNVAGLQFEDPGFVTMVKEILQESNLSANSLELEITENVIIKNKTIVDTVHALKELGTRIALDDFGSGYSNISYLRQLPIDRLKIDRTFIQNIRANPKDEAIIRAVIAMANSFNLQVLAEGVETQEQLKFLKDEQCHEAQGFLFSKPLTVQEFEDFMRSYQQPYQQLGDEGAVIKK
jgi:diguanylate cyclase (GGDEF)-like protein